MMIKVFNKRLFRDLKKNFIRYLALLLLTAMGMYVVTGIVGAADNVIIGTKQKGIENKVEDGQFSVFLPLTQNQEEILTASGITLEKMFSIDITLNNNDIIRVMKNRDNINLIDLDSGSLAKSFNEIVLEKRYCDENDIDLYDGIEIFGESFIVTGIGSVPDYDMPLMKFSSSSVKSELFGLAFVSSEQHNKIIEKANKTVDYTYAFRLNNSMSLDELKSKIKSFDFDYNDVDDTYFKEAISDTIGKKEDFQEGLQELIDGANELENGLNTLEENGGKLNDGTDLILGAYLSQANKVLISNGINETLTMDNYSESLDKYIILTQNEELKSLKDTLDNLFRYKNGMNEYTDGVNSVCDGSKTLSKGINELKTETDKIIDDIFDFKIDNLTVFISAGDNPRIASAAGDILMHKQLGLVAGIVIMVLFTYVISVFVIHQIQSESTVIGSLYALGVKKKDLIIHYLTLPIIISLIGGVIGLVLGFSKIGIDIQMNQSYSYFSLPIFDRVNPLYIVIYSIIVPPVVCAIVNYLVINTKLSQTTLSLIKNEQKTNTFSKIKINSKSFINGFQIRQMLKESRTGMTIVFGMFISILIFMIGMDAYALCINAKNDTVNSLNYEYMYSLKYPDKALSDEDGACYVESLSKTYLDFKLDVSIIGIKEGNKYFDANPSKGMNRIVIGKSVSQKYGLNKGDKLILSDNVNDLDYAFTVDDICEYSIGLTAFMDIDSMRELFGKEENYYNTIFSNSSLNIEEGRLYSVSVKNDIIEASNVFIDFMMPLIIMLTVVAGVIFCVVMYLMMNVMIDRAGFGISLVKIFGYKSNEIKKLYLNGNFYIILAGAVIGIPITKIISDSLYPWLVANVAVGMNLKLEWYFYLISLTAIILIYAVISRILVSKVKKVSAIEVLKNRE